MRSALLTVLVVSLAAAPARAQAFRGFGDPVARADLLFAADQPLAAYEILRVHVESNPNDYEALWRIARAGVVASVDIEDNHEQNGYLDPALHYAGIAVDLRPDGLDGVYWRGVAAGRRALNAGSRYSVELAQIVYEDAHTLLAADSLHAGAHNMLGKLNYEVMSLSRFERAVARMFMGNPALGDTSWENAEEHLAKAVEVSPDDILFRFDLGALHEKRGREEQAVVHLREALRLPPMQPIDMYVQEQAAALLEDIER
jgi:tetratricopeptide (TPR) repeat protein